MAKKKDELVPYDQVSPGFEAAYTGETSSTPVRESQMTSTLYSDEDGDLIIQGSTIPWIFPNEEGHRVRLGYVHVDGHAQGRNRRRADNGPRELDVHRATPT